MHQSKTSYGALLLMTICAIINVTRNQQTFPVDSLLASSSLTTNDAGSGDISTSNQKQQQQQEQQQQRRALLSVESSSSSSSSSRPTGGHLPHPSGKSASLCVAVRDVELYIDEFVDYYFGIGFSNIYFYDNSDENTLKGWQPSTPLQRHQTARVVHIPGDNMERKAHRECAVRLKEETDTTWVAFFSVDEFLVLRKHNHVVDLLEEHCPRGALAVNWIVIGASTTSFYRNFYRNLPVTRRFFYRSTTGVDRHVKSIVYLADMDLKPHKFNSQKAVHNFDTIHDTITKDSNGNQVEGPWNDNGPMDVVNLYHYQTKSQSEFNIKACQTGQARGAKPHCGKKAFRKQWQVYDDSVWVQMKKHVPKYALYDQFYVDEQVR